MSGAPSPVRIRDVEHTGVPLARIALQVGAAPTRSTAARPCGAASSAATRPSSPVTVSTPTPSPPASVIACRSALVNDGQRQGRVRRPRPRGDGRSRRSSPDGERRDARPPSETLCDRDDLLPLASGTTRKRRRRERVTTAPVRIRGNLLRGLDAAHARRVGIDADLDREQLGERAAASQQHVGRPSSTTRPSSSTTTRCARRTVLQRCETMMLVCVRAASRAPPTPSRSACRRAPPSARRARAPAHRDRAPARSRAADAGRPRGFDPPREARAPALRKCFTNGGRPHREARQTDERERARE